MIRLNGSIFIDGVEIYLEDFEIEIDEDLETPFDDFDDDDEDEYCHGYCEDCDECEDEDEFEIEFDLDDNENFDEYTDGYKDTLAKYVRKVYETDLCPHCLARLFDEFMDEVI